MTVGLNMIYDRIGRCLGYQHAEVDPGRMLWSRFLLRTTPVGYGKCGVFHLARMPRYLSTCWASCFTYFTKQASKPVSAALGNSHHVFCCRLLAPVLKCNWVESTVRIIVNSPSSLQCADNDIPRMPHRLLRAGRTAVVWHQSNVIDVGVVRTEQTTLHSARRFTLGPAGQVLRRRTARIHATSQERRCRRSSHSNFSIGQRCQLLLHHIRWFHTATRKLCYCKDDRAMNPGRGGHRGSRVVPFERALVTSYRLSIVTFPLS